MKRWNLFLPDELLDKVKVLAAKKGVPASELVRVTLEKYVAAVEKAALEAKNVA
jgi:predicted DNA binding CopG/RHH family protein